MAQMPTSRLGSPKKLEIDFPKESLHERLCRRAKAIGWHNHRLWIGRIGSIVVRSPPAKFDDHGDDRDEHEEHAQYQHHGIHAGGLFPIIIR